VVASAFAHVPGLEDPSGTVSLIPGPEVSRATYGYLAAGEQSDEYRFTVSTRVTREVAIIVPAYREHADFRPVLTIIAEETEPLEISSEGNRRREFEPFSLTYFWHAEEREITFEPGVEYVLGVAPGPGERAGRYVIVFGGPERFEVADIGGVFRQLPAIWFGTYGGAPFRFNWLVLVPIVLAAGVLALTAIGIRGLVIRRRPN
jgi:hypothetical protein